MCGPGNQHEQSDEAVEEDVSYYYDDATGYEIYRDDEDDEDEPASEETCEPNV